MRTPVALVLLMGLAACSDTAAPHGANLLTLSGYQSGACGRTERQLRCWGSVAGASSSVPVQPGAPINSLQLVRSSPYDYKACGLDQGGALFCWTSGGSGYGQLAPAVRFTDVTMGDGFQCALATDGTIYCWGYAWATGVSPQDTAIRECGTAPYTYECVPAPTPVASDQRFRAVAAGFSHTCALSQDSQVFCWGSGAIGAGLDMQSSQTPIPVESSDRFSSIAAGVEGSCGINTSGQLLCWGYNYGGMLGLAAENDYAAEPTAVAVPAGILMKTVTLGYLHSCAIDTAGAAWCWGTGGLGSGSISSLTPVPVLGGLEYMSLAAGDGFTCGIAHDGAWCWGSNDYGQLGTGGGSSSPIPVRVANQDQFDD